MGFHFELCDGCALKYQCLQFDPAGKYSYNLMPFCALTWPDEHPKGPPLSSFDEELDQVYDLANHSRCRDSVVRLVNARTTLWRTGTIPSDCEDIWAEAHILLPEWPGFRRLSLDSKQLQDLAGCGEELDEFMGAVRQDFPVVVVENAGAGLTRFSASRAVERQNDQGSLESPTRKNWWHFWKR